MTMEELKNELQLKIKELEWKNNLRSLEMITWLNELIKKMETKEEAKIIEKKVEEPKEEEVEKPTPKKKISFSRKKQFMQEVVYRQDPNDPNHLLMEINFQATAKQKEAFRYWEDNETTEI